MDLQDKVALITGGGSGMGSATADYLTKLGVKVALVDVNQERLEAKQKELNCLAMHCDITDEQQTKSAIEEISTKLGTPSICVNCAGIIHGSRIVGKQGAMPLEDFRRVIEVNLIGSFNVLRLIAEKMINSDPVDPDDRGVIINTASIAAFEGQIGQAAYSSSKGGIAGLTLPAARELAKFAIRVVAVAPGLIETPMLTNVDQKVYDNLVASTVFPKRLGKPEEFAKFVAQIIENPLINGSVIRLDGAVRLQ